MNRQPLQKISYGLYVICSNHNKKINGQIANSVFQITSEPPTVAISINKENCTHEYIQKSQTFTISILSKDTPMKFIGTFGFKCGRDFNKFDGISYIKGKTGSPIVTDHSIAYIEVNLLNSIDIGTHTIFIGEVINGDILSDKSPMTYDYYHTIKGGLSPKTAPTYNKECKKSEIKKKEEKKMDKYVCDVCGYVYEPEKGDPNNGIDPGTKFEDLPKDWVCPICGAPQSEFTKQE